MRGFCSADHRLLKPEFFRYTHHYELPPVVVHSEFILIDMISAFVQANNCMDFCSAIFEHRGEYCVVREGEALAKP